MIIRHKSFTAFPNGVPQWYKTACRELFFDDSVCATPSGSGGFGIPSTQGGAALTLGCSVKSLRGKNLENHASWTELPTTDIGAHARGIGKYSRRLHKATSPSGIRTTKSLQSKKRNADASDVLQSPGSASYILSSAGATGGELDRSANPLAADHSKTETPRY